MSIQNYHENKLNFLERLYQKLKPRKKLKREKIPMDLFFHFQPAASRTLSEGIVGKPIVFNFNYHVDYIEYSCEQAGVGFIPVFNGISYPNKIFKYEEGDSKLSEASLEDDNARMFYYSRILDSTTTKDGHKVKLGLTLKKGWDLAFYIFNTIGGSRRISITFYGYTWVGE